MKHNKPISKELKAYREFIEKHGNGDCYDTLQLAREYVDLKMAWWGSNLVCLGIDEKNGKFYPQFNVFD